MALCETEVINQIKGLPEYKDIDKKLDLMMLLKAIKKIVYTGCSDNILVKHYKAMAHVSFMSLQQERHEENQDFREQYTELRKVCSAQQGQGKGNTAQIKSHETNT